MKQGLPLRPHRRRHARLRRHRRPCRTQSQPADPQHRHPHWDNAVYLPFRVPRHPRRLPAAFERCRCEATASPSAQGSRRRRRPHQGLDRRPDRGGQHAGPGGTAFAASNTDYQGVLETLATFCPPSRRRPVGVTLPAGLEPVGAPPATPAGHHRRALPLRRGPRIAVTVGSSWSSAPAAWPGRWPTPCTVREHW